MNKNKIFQRIMTMALSVAMILGMLPVTALAAEETYYADISQGSVSVSSEMITYYNSDGDMCGAGGYIQHARFNITGTTAEHTITVDGIDADITLDGVDIQLTEENKCAFALENGAAVKLTLEDDTTNTLTSGNNCAGLQVPDGTTINIDGGGTLKANGGEGGAGIGGNLDIGGGNVTIRRGIITANGNWGGAGIGGGMGTAGGTLTITGGTIDAGDIGCGMQGDNTNDYCYISGGSVFEEQAVYIQSHTQVSKSDDTSVYMTTVTLEGIDEKSEVDSLSVIYNSDTYSYGTASMYTDESGKLYLWLPDGATVTGAEVGETSYSGTVTTTDDNKAAGTLAAGGGAGEDDNTAPAVDSVIPSGEDAAVSGDIKITFKEEMNTETVGTVSLTGGTDPVNLTDGKWSDDKTVYTVSYSGLESDTSYTIKISGFKNVGGTDMEEDTSNTFKTVAADENGTWDGITTDIDWYNDADSEFTISTAAELAGLAELVNGGNTFSGKTVKLGEDIVLNDVSDADNWDENTKDLNSWAPIGNDNAYFSGIFDGKGHTVSGIYIQVDKYGEGLFGSIKNGTVQNLGVTKSYICGKARIGGIVAYCDGGTILKCYNEGTVRSTGASMAGSEVGGIAGSINSLNNKAKVENCYNTGNVIGDHGCIGGIVGSSINGSSVIKCYNTGTLNYGSNTSFIGCIVGYSDVTVTDCYYDSTTCGYNDNTEGVQGKSTKNMQTATPFKNWSTDVWVFEANKYPQLIKPESSGESGDETYTAKVSPNSNTFAEAVVGYSDQTAQEFTIANTGTGTITGLSATLSAESSFVISTALSSQSIAPGGTATVSVRPKTGLLANTYTDTLTITGDNAVSFTASLSFTVTGSGSSIWDGNTDTSWYNDKDTEFTITTAEQLAGFAELVNGGNNFSGKTVKLGANIALNDVSNVSEWGTTAPKNTWTPIGLFIDENNIKLFSGTFDGDGHTVSGIYINKYSNYQSLFSWIKDAEIKNLGVTDSYINGNYHTAGVVAYSDSSTVKNVCVTNSYIESSNLQAAGVVENNHSGTVQNCYSTGIVKGYYGTAAGVVYDNSGTVQNCYYDKTICNIRDSFAEGKTTDWMKNATNISGIEGDDSTFNEWDTSIWVFESGKYPYFKPIATDADAVAAAKVALTDGSVNVDFGATQEQKTAAVQTYVDNLLKKVSEAVDVTATVTYNSETKKYHVSLAKGDKRDSTSLSMTVTEANDPDIKTVEDAKTAAAGATYSEIAQADAADKGAVKAAIEKIAKEAVKDYNVDVTINNVSYTAPTAGTLADPDGTDGSYSFTVTVAKGMQSAKTDTFTVTIRATVDENALTGTATITGNLVCGETLTATLKDGNSTGTLSYQWTRGGEDISGATESTYTLIKDDVGAVITVKITSSDKKGTRTSAPTSEIAKVDCEGTASAPDVLERTDTTVTLVEKEGYEYGVYNKEKDTVIWQDSNTFTNLNEGASYSFYQRIKETDTHKASDSSEAITVTTKNTMFYKWNYEGAVGDYTTQAADFGDKLKAPTTPQRAGYTFGGWYTDSNCKNPWNFKTDNVEHSVTFYAKWTEKSPETLEVIYVKGDATSGKVPKGRSNYKSGDTVTVFGNKGNLSKSGASFVGWSHGTTTYKEGDTFTINDNMILTAVWTEETKECMVTFNSNYAGGDTYTTQTVTYGSLLTKPAAPTRDGYSFIGWYRNAACTNPWSFELDTVTENMTLYTKWGKGTYSVSGTVVDDTTPPNKVDGATVKIMKGNIQFGDTSLTDVDGNFTVNGIPNGEYNIVITKNKKTVTLHIKVDGSDFAYEGQITLPTGNKNSKLDIVGSDTPNVVEDGLDDLFKDSEIYNEENKKTVDDGGAVEIRLTVQRDENAPEKESVSAQMKTDGYESGIMLDVDIEKTVIDTSGGFSDQSITALDDTLTLMIPLPEELQGKYEYTVYRTHDYGGTTGVKVDKITTTRNANNEYIEISGDKTYLTLHAKFFSTYAIAYKEGRDKKKKHSSDSSAITTQSYTITVKDSNGGSISPSGSVSVEKGKDKTFTFTSKEGYIISDVLIDGKSVGAVDSYTFKNMDATHTIKVVFATAKGEKAEKAEGLPYYLDSNDKKVFIGFASDVSGTMEYITPEGEMVQFTQNSKDFNDISGHWAKSNIEFITQREIFVGTEPNTFSPNSGMTRAMFATVIGRLYERSYGKITATGNTFSDVPENVYYSTYVSWAEKNEVIKGVGGNKFDPNRKITREEMAVILYRFAQFLKVSEGSSDTELQYVDFDKIDAWAMDAIKYCQENKIVAGRKDGSFAPQDTATRAEVATILKRFVETVVK